MFLYINFIYLLYFIFFILMGEKYVMIIRMMIYTNMIEERELIKVAMVDAANQILFQKNVSLMMIILAARLGTLKNKSFNHFLFLILSRQLSHLNHLIIWITRCLPFVHWQTPRNAEFQIPSAMIEECNYLLLLKNSI